MGKIFFGPWVGEFGWEYSHWHAFVNEASVNEFREYETVAASFSGRNSFYPNVTTFLSHPKEFERLFEGKRNYITDRWFGLRPSNDFFSNINYAKKKDYVRLNQYKDGLRLLNYYKSILPSDTRFIVPWESNVVQFNGDMLHFGISDFGSITKNKFTTYKLISKILFRRPFKYLVPYQLNDMIEAHLFQGGIKVNPINIEKQNFFRLLPISEDANIITKQNKLSKNIISIFPRKRSDRRPDKNFGEHKYLELIKQIKEEFPKFEIALIGEPNGSYFGDKKISGCIDLINIDNENRMNNQISVLASSAVSIGSISGAMLVALGADCPSIVWGYPNTMERTIANNPRKTLLKFIPSMHPSTKEILKIMKEVLKT